MSPHDSRIESSPPTKSHRGLRLAGVAGAVIAVVIIAYGVISRASESSHLRDWTEAQALPTVSVSPPKTGPNSAGLELPGRLEAYSRAPIFARVSGYLKSWKYDIGAKVKAGDLLAEIETPDVDQQLLQAKADLASAQANASLSGTTAKRWTAMLGSDSVSKQEVDEKVGDFTAKQALVKAAQANVDRINAMKGFTRIVAPFDGIVTARETDVGALINAGSSGGQELFVVSDTKKLRVYVSVPQNYVPSVPPGTKATMTVPEHPDKTYTGTVDASAQSVTAASGTTLMQISVDNSAGELLPGSYASVHLDLAGRANAMSIPSSALIFDSKGLAVATVDANNKVVLKPVTIARDLGKVIEIDSGLAATDRVIENPPDGIANGNEVRIAGANPKAQTAVAGKGKNEKG
jgi:RND family efflux transporter MFP subunit